MVENTLLTFSLALRILLYHYLMGNLDSLRALKKSDAKGYEIIARKSHAVSMAKASQSHEE